MKVKIENDKAIIHQSSLNIYQVIEDIQWDDIKVILKNIKLFSKNKELINRTILTAGPFSGFTVLHWACMEGNEVLVKLLVEDFQADVNVATEDGTQPIHIACLLAHTNIVNILGRAGANIDAEINKDIYSKFVKNQEWCNDFGNKITLLTFAIVMLHNDKKLAESLMNFDPNIEIKSLRNKTLLMYAIEKKIDSSIVKLLVSRINSREFINTRDDDGFLCTHYLLHPKKYGEYRYINEIKFERCEVLEVLIEAGVDIYATVNNNPDTFLLNMAAYRNCLPILRVLLPCYDSIELSKALYNSTLPHRDLEIVSGLNRYILEQQISESTHLIINDLINRQFILGYPVPKEEIQLLDKLIATDVDIKNYINDYKDNFVQKLIKGTIIQYDNDSKSVSHCDFILISCNDKKLQRLVTNKSFTFSFRTSFYFDIHQDENYEYFQYPLKKRILRARRRVELLKEFEKISHLRKIIPLPYDCILIIIEYLDNEYLENFINACIVTPFVSLIGDIDDLGLDLEFENSETDF